MGTGPQGTTLLGLRRGAEALGFIAKPVQGTSELFDYLEKLPLPAIIHWQGNHWVVLYGQKGNRYLIADPAIGLRRLSGEDLKTAWPNGVMLLLEVDSPRFEHQPRDDSGGLNQFLGRVWPYRWVLLEAIAINLVIGVMAIAFPLMMQLLTDDVLVRGDTQLLTTLATIVIALTLFRSAISFVQAMLIGQLSQRLELGLLLDYGYKLLRLPLSYFDARRSGEVVSRIGDVSRVNALVAQIVLGLPSQGFIAFLSLLVMLIYSWQLTLVAVLVFTGVTLVNVLFLPALRQKTQQLIVEGTENQGFLVETFRGAIVLKTTSATSQAWREYQNNFARLANLHWSVLNLNLISRTITGLLFDIANVGLLWLGSYFVINDAISIGQLIAFSGMSGNFLGFLMAGLSIVDELIAAQVVIQRLSEVLDATVEDDDGLSKPWAKIPDHADIVCSRLTFHHVGRADLLDDFTLTISGGRVTALIGQSGCGKSTLAKLLAGLYELQAGNIRYGSYNQADLARLCLRQQVVLVPQEPHFWSRSILENFRFSYPRVSFEQIVAVCQMTGADDFISELPNKYQTVLGEFGANLSGGQKQRLAIARAMLTNPPVLILDESTASLDPVAETQLLDRLLQERQGKTTILISHRPRVILRSDWVVFLERGQLKLQGSPGELSQISGDHLAFLSP